MKKIRTALLISGGGSTAEAIIKACQSKKLKGISPVAVISSQPDAGGIEKAKALGIKTYVVEPQKFLNHEAFGNKLLRLFKRLKVDLISQNGWMPLTPPNVVKACEGKIINQHPGPLDPENHLDFGGKRMYGSRVTCALLAYRWITDKDYWTQASTHFVNEKYDQGDLIRTLQMDVPKLGRPTSIAQLKSDPKKLIKTTKEVQKTLLPLEHQNVIETLKMFTKNRTVSEHKRTRPLVENENTQILAQAKRLAIRLFPDG